MSSFFADDGNSEDERREKQQRGLESIQADKANDSKDGRPTEHVIDEERAFLSEEQELKQLRESSTYRKYAEGRKRQRCASPDASESPKPMAVGRQLEENNGDEIDRISSEKVISFVGEGSSSDKLGTFTAKLDVQKELSLHAKTEEVIPIRRKISDRKIRSGRVIDPKIIDDSSDEESDSEDGSDSSGDAPIGPALPGVAEPHEQEVAQTENLPVHNEAILGESHSSYVSTTSMDRAGNRLVSGSIDSTVFFYDFNSMNRALRSFRTVNPLGNSPIRNLQYSATGGLLLCSGGSTSAIVMNRDGVTLSQTAKGDMYIVDMTRTKGHTGAILSAKWRPNSKVVASTSADATVRLWDVTRTERSPMVDNPVISQVRVTKLRNARGGKAVATALDWDANGKFCILGCNDGRIKIINPDIYSLQPEAESEVVIQQGAEITSVSISPETSAVPLILVRSTDDCLRVFDRRMLTRPVKAFYDLPNVVSETNAWFAGDTGEHFLTGTSAKRKGGGLRGSVRMFEAKKMTEVWKSETEEETGSVVHGLWHDKLNQIFYGAADGKVRVLYHPSESKKGVLSCLMKSDFRKKHGVVNLGVGEIFTPSTLHDQKSARGSKAAREGQKNRPMTARGRREASEAMKPKPYSGLRPTPGDKSTSLAKHIASGQVEQDWALDPREAILRYADVAKQDPKFTGAYQKTQPETMLAEKTAEQEEEESRQAIYERDRLRRARMQGEKQ